MMGFVSSVFPFLVKKLHGFTTDLMLQGGSSRTQIFVSGETTVVGVMSAALTECVEATTAQGPVTISRQTNITIAASGHIIQRQHPFKIDGIMTLKEIKAQCPETDTGAMKWESLGVFRANGAVR